MKIISQWWLGLSILFLCFRGFGQSGPPALPPTPIAEWPLIFTNWDTTRHFPPRGFTNLNTVASWEFQALSVDTNLPAFLNLYIDEPNGDINVTFDTGTISFWCQVNWTSTMDGGTGPGAWAPLWEAGRFSTNNLYGSWTLAISPDGNSLVFVTQTNGAGEEHFQTPIDWDAGDWHNVVLTYSPSNCALYLEGNLVTNTPPIVYWPGDDECVADGFWLGSDPTGTLQAHAQFQELETYDSPLSTNFIQEFYADTAGVILDWGGSLPATGTTGGGFHGDDSPPFPGGTNTNSGSGSASPAYPDYTFTTNYAEYTNFWLTIGFTNSATQTAVAIESTLSNLTYLILTNSVLDTNLADWGVWQTLTASNSVTVAPFFTIGTNNIFFAAQLVLISGPGDLPDWWEMEYGLNPNNISSSTNGISNDYADPAGDGWSNLQKYQNGWNPNTFYTPPTPQVSVTPLSGDNGVTVTWSANQGSVTGYTIYRNGSAIATVSATTLSYVDTSVGIGYPYQVQADYTSGNSSLSAAQYGADPNLAASVVLCRGPQSQFYLLAPNIPKAVTSLTFEPTIVTNTWPYLIFNTYLQRPTNFVPTLASNYFQISVTNFINGRYAIPSSLLPYFSQYVIYYQADGANGTFGPVITVSQDFAQDYPPDDGWLVANEYWPGLTVPFLDGTTQLQQNLVFQLESADVNGPLQFTVNSLTDPRDYSGEPINEYSTITVPSSYAYANFHESPGSYEILPSPAWINEFKPFDDNYFYRNFVVNSSADVISNGSIASGAFYYGPIGIEIYSQAPYAFPDDAYALLGGTNAIAPLLSTNAQYIYSPFPTAGNIGVSWVNTTNLTLASGQFNSFGLDNQSVIDYYTDGTTLYSQTLSPGAVVPDQSYDVATQGPYFYSKVAAPQLNTVGFYFALADRDYIPGESGFTITNGIGPIVGSVGVPLNMGAWAEQAIVNGNGNQRGYLELYWDKAFTINTNGSVTTNQTGILSEYGEFFPTDPAWVTLTTKSNSTTSAGQIDLPVIGLYTDANHDGVIDTSFNGPDFVTPYHPFQFWVNDDNDSGDTGGNDIPGYPALLGQPNQPPNGLSGVVNGARDLIDFFPVYVDIGSVLEEMQISSAFSSLQFRLSQPDGALNFVYTSLGTNSFTAYQTSLAYLYANTNVTQITSSGVVLNSAFVQSTTNNGGIILVEAWTNTSAPLILDVLLGTNVVAQSQLPLSITGVEQMFRHKNLTSAVLGVTDGPADRLTETDAPNAPDDNGTNIIFVHGYNVNPDQARGWQSEMFKRFYWSGSHARFYGITWDAYDTQITAFGNSVAINLQTNIIHAFQTAPALNNFLNSLPGTNILMAHSLGNMLVLSTLNDYSNSTIKTFFMLDAAVALEAIDGPAAINTNMVPSDWLAYPPHAWASEWFNLFSSTDARSQLTWSNRFANLNGAQVYNYYSSGEEVLRNYYGDPPSLSGLAEQTIIANILSNTPFAANLWGLQEKEKGRMSSGVILSSSREGWGYNSYYGTISSPPNATTVSALTSSQLQTNPVFNTSFDGLLFTNGTSGSTYAHANLNAILSDAIPAVSWATGANAVPDFGVVAGSVDMQTLETGWPASRPTGPELDHWYHSDAREVAYPYTHTLFDDIVGAANLK